MAKQRFKTRDVEKARAVVAGIAPGMVVHPLGRDFEVGVEAMILPRLTVFRMRARQTRFLGVGRGFAGGTLVVEGAVQIAEARVMTGTGRRWRTSLR